MAEYSAADQHMETVPASRSGRLLGFLEAGVVAGVPIVIAPNLSLHFDVAPKVVLLLCGAGIMALLWNGYVPGARQVAADRGGRVFVLLLGAQAISLAMSSVLSADPALSVTGTNWRRLGLITHCGLLLFTFVTIAWLAADRRRVTYLLRAVALSGTVAALYSALQYFGIDPWLPAHFYHEGEADWGIVRPPGTMGHAGYLATYLLSVAFFSWGLSKSDSAAAWRTVGALAAGISAIAVVLTGTRGAVVGLAAGAVILWFWFRPRFGKRGMVVGTLLAVGIAGFYFSPAGQRLRNRVQWSLEDVHGGARLWLWRDSVRMGADFWAVGTGPETFSAEFPRYQSIELAQAYPNRYNESPHNMLLDAFTAQGAAGLLVLCGLIIVPLRLAMRTEGSGGTLTGFVAAGFAAAIVSNQFLVFTAPTALHFYFGAGLLVALGLPAAKDGAGTTPRNTRWRWAFPLVAAALAVAVIVFAIMLAVADRGMWRARERAAAGNVEGAIAAYGQVLRWKPRGMDTDLWFSRLMAGAAQGIQEPAKKLGAWLAALSAAERATAATEAPLNAHYNLAVLYAMSNDFAGTERALRNAAAAAPQWYKPHWMLAEVLREAGRLDEARAAAEKAMELNGGKDAEVAATWEGLRRRRGEKDAL